MMGLAGEEEINEVTYIDKGITHPWKQLLGCIKSYH